jgi:hypothetical protein
MDLNLTGASPHNDVRFTQLESFGRAEGIRNDDALLDHTGRDGATFFGEGSLA